MKTTDRQEFIEGYCKLYELHFGGPYLFNGGKDGKAVKRFLDYGFPVAEALEILADSFTRTGYPYDGTATIAGFVSMWPHLLARRAKQSIKQVSRFDLRQQIDTVKLEISRHPHNHESIRHNPAATVDTPLPKLKQKLSQLENQLSML